MFVRWKRRELKPPARVRERQWVLYAVLVKSERVDGKPRQRVIAHLAHIREHQTDSTAHRDYFWDRADAKLDSLALSPDQRARIENKLLERVKRPTAKEIERMKREREELHRELQRLLDTWPRKRKR